MANQTTVQLKRSSVAGKVPDAANIDVGEPVVNLNDKIIFTKDGGGNVIVIGAGTTSNVSEGINLYYSNSRVYSNVTQIGYITSSSLNGYATNSQLSIYALDADLTTANVTELTNLYYTNARVYANVTPLLDAKANLTGATFTGNVIATNLLPPSDDSGAVGNASRTWNNGHFTNLSVDTLGSISGTLNVRTALDLGTDDVLRFGDADNFEIYYDGTNSFLDLNSGNLIFRDVISNRATFVRHTGDLILSTGNAQANYFIGDGSALTNVRVANSNITGNTISSKLEPTGVTAGSYGGATNVAAIVIDQQGRITSASNAAITATGGGGGSPFNTAVNRNVGGAITTTSSAIFIAPSTAGIEYIIHSIHVTNINATVQAEVTGAFDGTTYASNINFASTIPVPRGTAVELLKRPKVLQPNDKIQLSANVNNALHAVVTYETQSSTSYFGSGVDITSAATATTLFTATANSMIESILLSNDDTVLDVKATVTWTNASDSIQGYYCFDLVVPADSTIELLESPKYLENGHKIRVQANQANRLEAMLSGKTL